MLVKILDSGGVTMKHIISSLLTLLIGLVGILWMVSVQMKHTVETNQPDVTSKVLRFHVRANSDSEEDQALKIKVKDAVIEKMEPLLKESKSLEESKEIIEEQMPYIEALSLAVLQTNGCTDQVSVYFSTEYFPVKQYGDLTFPAGEYEAVRIDIGEAKGKNWWCVMFPPLCLIDATYTEVPKESKEQLKEVVGEEEYNRLIPVEEGIKEGDTIKIKFKIVEEIKKLFKSN